MPGELGYHRPMSITIVKSRFGIYNAPTKGLIRNKLGIYIPDIEVNYTRDMHRAAMARRERWDKLREEFIQYMTGRWGLKRFQRGSIQISTVGTVAETQLGAVLFDAADYSVADVVSQPTDATAEIRMNTGGLIVEREGGSGSFTNLGSWFSAAPVTNIGDDFTSECRQLTGSLSIGSQDTEEALTSNRVYGVEETGTGQTLFTGTLAVQENGSAIDLDTAGVTLRAQAT